ncbi:hypothetical protein M514_09497 [Trichuris suis]|uniref:Uncharacterized protein n=1 Tax=Trichuris suis TaxID=68888 RepID=A0A085NA29_9BILA|nr:hypothetical protein M513_09497 [Trichuris suis]KFD66325.1 hypothetical protein M514_09497 [Trichuris suis]
MSCAILSNSSSPGLNRLLHINSQRCSGSAIRSVPHRCGCARFPWDHIDSIVCVCAPLDGSTKCSEWLTDRCLKSCRARHEYARHPAVTMVVPGRTCRRTMGRRVAVERSFTSSTNDSPVSR